MGACLTLDAEEKKAKSHSQDLDKYLVQCAKQDTNVVKILLLGISMLSFDEVCVFL